MRCNAMPTTSDDDLATPILPRHLAGCRNAIVVLVIASAAWTVVGKTMTATANAWVVVIARIVLNNFWSSV